jgi:hypothetical protein
MNHLLWRLSGASLFVGQLVDQAQRGVSVVVSARHNAPQDLADRICQSLHGEGLPVDLISTTSPPLEAVGKTLCCDAGFHSLDSICDACNGLRCFVVDIQTPDDAMRWSQFLLRLQHRARQNPVSQRPVLVLIHRCAWPVDATPEDVASTSLSWDDALSKADLVSFSHALLARRKLPGVLGRVLVHTLAEICLTDIELMQAMCGEALDEMALPYQSLRVWAQDRGFDQAPPRVYMDGELLDHAAWLAWTNDREGLRRRIWAAQVRVLLPWVEEQRMRLLDELILWLPTEYEGQVRHEMEVGTLDFVLSRSAAPPLLKSKIRMLKTARNDMAHRRIVSYLNLQALSRIENA